MFYEETSTIAVRRRTSAARAAGMLAAKMEYAPATPSATASLCTGQHPLCCAMPSSPLSPSQLLTGPSSQQQQHQQQEQLALQLSSQQRDLALLDIALSPTPPSACEQLYALTAEDLMTVTSTDDPASKFSAQEAQLLLQNGVAPWDHSPDVTRAILQRLQQEQCMRQQREHHQQQQLLLLPQQHQPHHPQAVCDFGVLGHHQGAKARQLDVAGSGMFYLPLLGDEAQAVQRPVTDARGLYESCTVSTLSCVTAPLPSPLPELQQQDRCMTHGLRRNVSVSDMCQWDD